MLMLVYTVAAMIAFLIAYAFDLGSEVSALIFGGVLLVGVIQRAAEPITRWVRG